MAKTTPWVLTLIKVLCIAYFQWLISSFRTTLTIVTEHYNLLLHTYEYNFGWSNKISKLIKTELYSQSYFVATKAELNFTKMFVGPSSLHDELQSR